ncbi:MAG: iron-sulfur cluster repair di-iron protein [Acidimicrobiia bacterium]|nr:iron-sulfur cluster repair di-iron protein [Acidimicrobiia bacterium]
MTGLTPNLTLAEIVNAHPSLARELEARDLDYCCGGATTVEDACATNGLDVATVLDELARAGVDEPAERWSTMGLVELVDHLEATHHAYLWSELPRLAALLDKVVGVHGERHPELGDIDDCFTTIRSDLEPHLTKEERVLFPMVRELAAADSQPSFHCGSIQNPISVMLTEHDTVGDLLRQLRSLTDGYTPPTDGCGSYVALFAGLETMEADTHLHIHKENNLLFPAVAAAERRLVT